MSECYAINCPKNWVRTIKQVYDTLNALELAVTVEDASSHGCVDMSVDFDGHNYLFEFKVVELLPEGKALEQIKHKGYADKHHASGKPNYLIC